VDGTPGRLGVDVVTIIWVIEDRDTVGVANFFELVLLVNAVVNSLLLVEEPVVIRVEREDRNFGEVDNGEDWDFLELDVVDSELAVFLLPTGETVVIRVEEDDHNFGEVTEGEAADFFELDVIDSELLDFCLLPEDVGRAFVLALVDGNIELDEPGGDGNAI
jgi:hypothetical protein